MKLKIKLRMELKFLMKFLYLAVIALFILSLILVISFLYKNLYQTILSSEEILILKQQIAPETFDINKFNQIIEEMEIKQKEKVIDWSKIGNIFKRGFRSFSYPVQEITPILIE